MSVGGRTQLDGVTAIRDTVSTTPRVLFVCVHNAGRSQMAAALLRHYAGDRVAVRSAGSDPADSINPAVPAVMAELGIHMSGAVPQKLREDSVRAADVVVTMGCGDACPVYHGTHYEDWVVDDPAGKGVDEVRKIRDDIESRVKDLVGRLTTGAKGGAQ
jgi:arsenate reductase